MQRNICLISRNKRSKETSNIYANHVIISFSVMIEFVRSNVKYPSGIK